MIAGRVILAENPVVPRVDELVLGLVAFFVIFGLLAWKLLPNIRKTLEERTDAIEGGIKRAEEAQAEAQRTVEQYRDELARAQHEASRLREQANERGAAIIAEMREEGQRQREQIVAAGQAQLAADRQSAQTALRQDVGRLAVDLAGKIVGESVADEARQSRIIDRFLDELERRAAEEASA